MGWSSPSGFQFTHPGGVRHLETAPLLTLCIVSIHAPGRGATELSEAVEADRIGFNSRTREGCDGIIYTEKHLRVSFNSRTREGCDLRISACRERSFCFNSRTREGCDTMEAVLQR